MRQHSLPTVQHAHRSCAERVPELTFVRPAGTPAVEPAATTLLVPSCASVTPCMEEVDHSADVWESPPAMALE